MIRNIVLSKRSSIKLGELLNYLEQNWSERVKKDFLNKLARVFAIIKDKPTYFESSEIAKGVHRCVVSKQTTIYYKYDDKAIYVVAIFDTRQDLGRLKREID